MASHVVVLDSSGEKAIYASTLRWKYSSKVIGLTSTLLAIGLAGLIFADGDVEQCQRRRALRVGINPFNGILGAELIFVRRGQGIGVSTFGQGFRTFLVNVGSCLGAKDLKRAFDQSCWQGRPRL